MKILIVVGTRPNFIKITQFKKIAKKYPGLEVKIVHTGQHFDREMADIFFQQLDIYPDYFLNAANAGIINQFADIMHKLDNLITNVFKPDIMIVPGDVNSTLAAALVANKKGISLAHIESGLRSFDREMPEEVNRVLTDIISNFYFVTEKSGMLNLSNGEMKGGKFFVGNTMIDTLVAFKSEIDSSEIISKLSKKGLKSDYILVTLHRPSNVDNGEDLAKMVELVNFIAIKRQIIFPIHPRTRNKLEHFKLIDKLTQNENVFLMGPLDYFSFQKLIKESKCVITDSGGIQEETTFYGVPCLTLRENTERPITIEKGTNVLVKFRLEDLENYISSIEEGTFKKGVVPELWDGKATERILRIIASL